MATYYARKIGSLIGATVEKRGDGITQWNASDKWNRHNYPTDMNVPPAPPLMPHRATREFGLMEIPLEQTVLENAPDVSKYVIRNDGLLGHIAHHYQ